MAEFAPIASLGTLKNLRAAGLLGNYHLWLAHKILEDPKGWSEFAADLLQDGEQTIIMDNSLIEMGKAMPMEQVLEASYMVGAKFFVLPDALTESAETVRLSLLAMKELNFEIPLGIAPLGVVQGKSFGDFIWCAEKLAEIGCQMFSVPRIAHKVLGTRTTITEAIIERWKMDIHLLGFSDSLVDDMATACMFNKRESYPIGVLGIDSSEPIRIGLNNRRVNSYPRVCPPREADWLETEYTINDFIEYNINWVRRFISV